MKKIMIMSVMILSLSVLPGCQTDSRLRIKCDAPTKETVQEIKIDGQKLKIGAIREIDFGKKKGASDWSDNKTFHLSLLNGVGGI